MVWKFCEIWKSYGKRGPEGQKFCEILSHSVRYGMNGYQRDRTPDLERAQLPNQPVKLRYTLIKTADVSVYFLNQTGKYRLSLFFP